MIDKNTALLKLNLKLNELSMRSIDREAIAIKPQPDSMDNLQHISDAQVVIHSMSTSASTQREVRAALTRLQDGTYGECLSCGEEIGAKRLAAIPWARLCVVCQEEQERNYIPVLAGPEMLEAE